MNKSLLKELPELVNANIITAETARQIEIYFSTKKENAPNRFTVILGILGALLAGLGIVLVVAHNWDELNRLIKTIFSFLPLIIGQVLCIYTLLKQNKNVVWQECSATILFFAIISSISLISQVYHIDGKLSDFLLTCMLLSAPLIYIMPSSVVALLYIAGSTWYACDVGYGFENDRIPYLYLVLLLLMIPHYLRQYKTRGNFFILENWLLSISFLFTLGCFIDHHSYSGNGEKIMLGYISLCCAYYLIGRSGFIQTNKLFANPFLLLGATGVIVILLTCSFSWPWDDFRYYHAYSMAYSLSIPSGILLVLTVWLIFNLWKKEEIIEPIGLSSLILMLAFFLFSHSRAGTLIVNIWILTIAIYFIRRGSMQNHFGILNFGLAIIAFLAICRFFDDSIPFIWRGLFFLATGAGFFIANYLLVKKRKSLTQNESL